MVAQCPTESTPGWRTGARMQLGRFPSHVHICDLLHPSVAANSRNDHVTVSARGLHLTQVSQPSAMRRQRLDLAALLRRQPQQHILEIRVRIMPIHACRLDHGHGRRCPFAAAQRSSGEPVGTARLPWPDRIFDRVMVDGTAPSSKFEYTKSPPCRGKSTATYGLR
jgi:hypothetical protein